MPDNFSNIVAVALSDYTTPKVVEDKNKGWVSVGISHDTGAFAVNSIRSWWYQMGKETYPDAKKL